MSMTLLPADWRAWLRHQVEGDVKPADLLRQLTARGHLSAQVALLAIDEALTDAAKVGPLSPARCDPRPRLDTDRRLLTAQGRQVLVRAALATPCVAVLDNLLDELECTLLRAVAVAVAAATGDAMRIDAGSLPCAPAHPIIKLLAARLSALVGWPLDRFQPLQIRRLRPGESCRPRSDGAGGADGGRPAGGRGGPIVGSFVVYLDAPAGGGATCLPGAWGFRVLPHAGTAVWFDHQWPGGAGAAALQAATEPTAAEPPWVVVAWLHAQAWRPAETG
jgi:prolyl 4-hydroxylase